MASAELVLICGAAFLWVFLILCLLALLMRLLMRVFPGLESTSDPAVVAALTAVLGTVLPGTKVTKIEEKP
jgi:hypothetical protein